MRSSWYEPGRGLSLVERAAPPVDAGQVEVAPAYTGICGTDLHALHGAFDARVGTGTVLGHEVSATVTAVAPDVVGWSVGDRVAVFPQRPDGTCLACRRGHAHVCQHMDFLGLDSPGALQERWVVPAANLVALPDGLDLAVAALAEPTAVAVHDVGRAGVGADDHVLVVGGGPVGVLIALVARARGADVRVVEPTPGRRATLEELGFTTHDPSTVDVVTEVEAWTDGGGAEVVFEVSGVAAGIETAVRAAGVRGRVCVVGIHPQARPVDLHRVFERELTLLGARLYTREDFTLAVDFVAAADFPGRHLITRVLPLSELPGATDGLHGADGMKVLVDCRA